MINEQDKRELFNISKIYLELILHEESVQEELLSFYQATPGDLTYEVIQISKVIYHTIITTPSIHIKININLSTRIIGYYSIYLDNQHNFLDEFFYFK